MLGFGRFPTLKAFQRRRGTGFCFLTHKTDAEVLNRILHLLKALDEGDRLHVLIHLESQQDLPRRFSELLAADSRVSVHHINLSKIESDLGIRTYKPGQMVPGSAHLPALWVFLSTRHRFYFSVEWDVVLKGDWREFIREASSRNPDLICSWYSSRSHSPGWYWWTKDRERVMEIERHKGVEPHRAFFPAWGASPKLMKAIVRAQREGWHGHFEWVIPTIAHLHGMQVEDFSKSSWVRAAGSSGSVTISPFRASPNVATAELEDLPDRRIAHPVKDLTQRL